MHKTGVERQQGNSSSRGCFHGYRAIVFIWLQQIKTPYCDFNHFNFTLRNETILNLHTNKYETHTITSTYAHANHTNKLSLMKTKPEPLNIWSALRAPAEAVQNVSWCCGGVEWGTEHSPLTSLNSAAGAEQPWQELSPAPPCQVLQSHSHLLLTSPSVSMDSVWQTGTLS